MGVPFFMCCAHVSGSLSPFSRMSIRGSRQLQQTEKGSRKTYREAQNQPTGQPMKKRPMNHKMLQRMFMMRRWECHEVAKQR